MAARMCPICGAAYGTEIAFCQTDGTKLMDAVEVERMRADPDPLVRVLIGGRYRVIKRIGEGGMGIVYLAEHEAIEKRVAVKVLKEQYAQREDVVRRFQQEAKSASRVKHEGVLEVFDFGRTEDGRFFLAMELLDGTDLANLLEREGVIEPNRAARLSIKMARALGAAHAKGVIHRDMKPENVFVRLGDDGREHIKIVDFGIAQLRADGETETSPDAKIKVHRKLTKTGMIFGTPEYMSPEQAAGKNIDARIDVYALGIIMFEMLTGKTPFQGDTFMAILSSHLLKPIPALVDEAPPGFHCSPDLEAVVRRALAKDPEGRFRNMQELVEALLATPEGMSDEALRRPSYVPSSQFPSGMSGQAVQLTPTEVRLRSAPPGFQAAETMASVENPLLVRPPATTDLAVTVTPKKSGGALVFGGALVVVGVMGAAGWLGIRYLENTEAKPTASSSPTPAPTRTL
jgi:serine/threonine protein kinase